MLQGLVEFAIRFRVLVLAAAAAMLFFGAAELRRMPVDVLPEFSPPIVEIQTEALGLSAKEVETMVTLSIEELMLGLPWLKALRSESVAGLSSIRMEFDPGTPLMRARQLVQERLTTAFLLPNVAKPPIMQQPVSSTNRVLMVSLSSRTIDPIALSVLSQWTVKPKLLGVPGVAKVAIWGERRRQLQVQVDPEAMRKNAITLRQVIASTGDSLWVSHLSFLKSSVPGTGGYLDTPNQRMEIRHILPVSSPADLAKIAIDGTKLRLGDVASVVEGHPPLIGDAVVEDGQGLLLVIEKFPGVNTLEVTRAVEAALEDLRPGLSGVKIDAHAFRPASFVEWSLANVAWVALAGGALAVAGAALLLLSWRVLLIGLVSIPVALMAATLALHATGTTANALVLAGLGAALAVLIDDLVVAGHRLRRQRTGAGPSPVDGVAIGAAVLDEVGDIARPLVFALLIGLLAIAPLLFLAGRAGIFMLPLATAYATALAAALVVMIVVVPALGALLAGKAPAKPAAGSARAGVAERLSPRIVANPFWATIVLVQLAAVGLALAPLAWRSLNAGQALLPRFDERDLVIHWDGEPGLSREEMVKGASWLAADLRQVPGVRSVNAHIGRAISGDQTVGINSSRIWIRVDPEVDHAPVLEAIRSILAARKGFDHRIHTYLNDRLGTSIAGSEETFTVRVFGQRREPLDEAAAAVKDAMSRVDGLWNVHVEGVPKEAQVQVEVDLLKAAQAGVKPGDVRRAASTLFAGLEVGQIFESQKVFEVVVWSKPETRANVASIADALIELPAGGHVRLGDVGTVQVVPTPSIVRREDVSQFADVVGQVRGRSLAAIEADVRERLRNIEFKLGYYPKVLGDVTHHDATSLRVVVAAVVALAGTLLLLQAALGSWLAAALVLLLLPLAISGAALAPFLVEGRLSLGAMLGLLAVLTLTVRHTLLLAQHALDLELGGAARQDAVAGALAWRGRAVLVTACAIALAFAPVLYLGVRPGLELLAPMAVAILGGLVTSTMAVLLVVPVLLVRLASTRAEDDAGFGLDAEMAR